MALAPELLDQLLKDYQRPEDMLGPSGLFEQAACEERCVENEDATEHETRRIRGQLVAKQEIIGEPARPAFPERHHEAARVHEERFQHRALDRRPGVRGDAT